MPALDYNAVGNLIPQRDASGWMSSPWQDSSSAFQPSATSNAYNLAGNTARSNLAATPYNTQLADVINATNQAAQQSANASRLGPQGQAVQGQILSNIGAGASGQLSPGTMNLIGTSMAERGARGGFGADSPNTNAALMRAFAITAEDQQARAASQYGQLLNENPSAPIYSAGNNLLSPGTYASVANAQTGSGGGGGGGRAGGGGGGVSYAPPAPAPSVGVPYGGGYPGAGGGAALNPYTDVSGAYDAGAYATSSDVPANTLTTSTGSQNTFGLPQNWSDWMPGYA